MPIHGYPGNVITANPTAPTVSSATGVWTTEQQLQAVSQGNWPGYEYPISRSLRFNSADSAYLNRTPASASNRKTWTLSLWNKGGNTSANDYYFLSTGGVSTERFTFSIRGNGGALNVVQVVSGVVKLDKQTTALHRDPSAWYHFVLSVDTTQSTPAVNVYVNGVQITSFSANTNTLAQNDNTQVNNTNEHDIGKYFAGSNYFDGYLTEINFVDGQALTPSSFGLNDPETGVWSPKRYTGTYGTNGFYLNFSDNSGTTSTTLGKDSSGNGNNWTPNNFSVTAGAGNDSLVDSPTSYGTDTGVGGEVRGNYCTLNPLRSGATLSNGNLNVSQASATAATNSYATIGVSSGKWYWEYQTTSTNPNYLVGFWSGDAANLSSYPIYYWDVYGNSGATTTLIEKSSGTISSQNTAASAQNDIIGVALDYDGATITFYKNNSVIGIVSGMTINGVTLFPIVYHNTQDRAETGVANFGQRPFAYTAPSGFKALCTQNLPTPTIGATSTTQANDYFNVVTYTATPGTGATISGVGFQPDLLWVKNRDNVEAHYWQDSVRGFSPSTNVTKMLKSNSTAAESSLPDITCTTTSDGFTVVDSAPGADEFWFTNRTYVGWCWKANGAGGSNTAGTITSTVSANTTSGFSIVTYTGTGANATVGHGLGVTPAMYIVKRRTGGIGNWAVWHTSLSNTTTSYILLDSTAAQSTSTSLWGSTAATSTTLGLGTSVTTNNSSDTYVAYCFAPVAGYSAFGSYTGNGSTDGPFVFTGFRPRYVLIKRSAGDIGNWVEHDTARESYNLATTSLYPNLSNAETVAASQSIDILSNGFKLRNISGDINASGGTYIYACFAENPFKYSLAR